MTVFPTFPDPATIADDKFEEAFAALNKAIDAWFDAGHPAGEVTIADFEFALNQAHSWAEDVLNNLAENAA